MLCRFFIRTCVEIWLMTLNSTIFFLLRIGVLHIRNGSLECALEQLILRRVSHKRPRDEPVHHIPRLDSDRHGLTRQ